eukprot:TRINITY_DN11754_c0_g2_i1.p2 TRINITY_DN11754_c0_g2~~TRINITY_DN11754_c0_g2_i1.p2  ORF type:complete len:394 (+),score=55.24 TRINITY_DN11754_c0_g2_i1:2244-3425(+)
MFVGFANMLLLLGLAQIASTAEEVMCPSTTYPHLDKRGDHKHCICPHRYECNNCGRGCRVLDLSFKQRCVAGFKPSCTNCKCDADGFAQEARGQRLGKLWDLRSQPICSYDNVPVFNNSNNFKFVFTISNGHTGTGFLGSQKAWLEVFRRMDPRLLLLHEFEANKSFLTELPSRKDFCEAALSYVVEQKVPRLIRRMQYDQHDVVYQAGHQVLQGILPALLAYLGPAASLVRLRRNRLETAFSFSQKAIGPCGLKCKWCPCPMDLMTRCPIDGEHYRQLTTFEKYLWAVDEMECTWQSIRKQFPEVPFHIFEWSKRIQSHHLIDLAAFLNVTMKILPELAETQALTRANAHVSEADRKAEQAKWAKLLESDQRYQQIVGLSNCSKYSCVDAFS